MLKTIWDQTETCMHACISIHCSSLNVDKRWQMKRSTFERERIVLQHPKENSMVSRRLISNRCEVFLEKKWTRFEKKTHVNRALIQRLNLLLCSFHADRAPPLFSFLFSSLLLSLVFHLFSFLHINCLWCSIYRREAVEAQRSMPAPFTSWGPRARGRPRRPLQRPGAAMLRWWTSAIRFGIFFSFNFFSMSFNFFHG